MAAIFFPSHQLDWQQRMNYAEDAQKPQAIAPLPRNSRAIAIRLLPIVKTRHQPSLKAWGKEEKAHRSTPGD